MKVKAWTYELGDMEYYRFSIYHFGTNMQMVYLFRIKDVLIDTAQSKSRDKVKEVIGGMPLKHIVLTHHHEDHTGNAAYLKYKTGAKVYAHPLCCEMLAKGIKVPPLARLMTGNIARVEATPINQDDVLDFGHTKLHVLHTPGHTDDHLAFVDRERGWLWPGDLYVADRIKYFESSESIDVQIQSLEKMCAEDFDVLLCSHNPKVENGKKRLERKLQLFQDFYGEVARMQKEGMKPDDILKALGRKENWFYRLVTVGHFTAVNMVKSVIRAEGARRGA